MEEQKQSTSTRDEDTRCGWFGFSPSVAQRFARSEWVLACFCAAGFVQGMVISGFVNVSLPTLERRFHLRSVESGLIVSMYNVGSLLFMAPVTFFGSERHKPRIMAVGVAMMGVGSFIYSLPHFIAPQYKFSHSLKDLCPFVSGPTLPPGSGLRSYRFIFMLANLVHGCSTVPFYTLSVAYMDDNLTPQKSSWYIGIYYTAAIMGPGVGFILAGMFLGIYTDVSVDPSSIGMSPSSNVWIGAWWIGFVITGFSALLISLPTFGFPKRLPDAVNTHEAHEVDFRALKGDTLQVRLADMPRAVFYLVQNYTFLFISLATTVEMMIGSGYSNFVTKLFESQFGMTSSGAALLLGMIGIPSASLGCFMGGYVVSKLNLSCSNIIRMCVLISVMNWFVFYALLVACPNQRFEGIDIEKKMVLTPKCSSDCMCPFSFNPICGRDHKMYTSPCLAGCRNETQDVKASTTLYTDCDCIELEGDHNDTEHVVEAERVRCTQECSAYTFYMAATFICIFSTFYISAPSISVTIRCVMPKQKSFALGVQWACIRLLGTIPAPLIFGKAVDMACEIWSSVFDGDTNDSGHCAIYDNGALSRNMAAMLLLLKTMSVVLFACASFTYQPTTTTSSPT
ncbi:solute carrier organic anion transporter family member 4A1-like isoform X3 [Dermacentor andersoni]|uniref:solute carrier organic anion transporter family member 4A1-like isoform X3 n=1 Tax=Dermacentor andersoni TaxID=34620 RepID=UPI002417C497|nr:solute carrier organic anion transporter family member 4A1-like isoform X2 [Dermacentor andersoni]